MSKPIIKLTEGDQSWYLEWTTIGDGPAGWGMSLDYFKAYYKDEYGKQGMRGLAERLERVEEHGSSYEFDQRGSEDVVCINRASPNGSELTVDEIIERYCKTHRGNE